MNLVSTSKKRKKMKSTHKPKLQYTSPLATYNQQNITQINKSETFKPAGNVTTIEMRRTNQHNHGKSQRQPI